MRAAVEGLNSPYSLVDLLPWIYQEDPFTKRLTAGWDEVIAPLISTLDCLDAYLDPELTPEDLLEWIADRMGAQLDAKWPLERKRTATAHAFKSHRACGTAAEVHQRVALATGASVELFDSGGVVTSRTPGTPFPTEFSPTVLVRVTAQRIEDVNLFDLDLAMKQCMPAHVSYRTEVVLQ